MRDEASKLMHWQIIFDANAGFAPHLAQAVDFDDFSKPWHKPRLDAPRANAREISVGMTDNSGPYAEIANRLGVVRRELGKTQKMMSSSLGLGATTWQRLESGINAPSGETLLKIAELGFNPGWVLTGVGSRKLREAQQGLPDDKNLIARVSVAISEAYREVGHHLPPARAGEELHAMLVQIVGAAESPEEYIDLVPVMAQRLRKRLRSAAAEPGTGKASA